MNSEELLEKAHEAMDGGHDVFIGWHSYDYGVVEFIEIENDTYYNENIDDELDFNDEREARRYYYG